VRDHLKKNGRTLIGWSSFGKVRTLKAIADRYGFTLREAARRKGKRGFVYYIFVIE
jgi:hypothetical protein